MKKLVTFLALLLVSIPAFVLANSGPAYWDGYPSSEIMVIDTNSPINVENEVLVFDFSESDNYSHTIYGKVTATYEMANPTDELLEVDMVFPFVGVLAHFSENDVLVATDEQPVSYDLYLGDIANLQQEGKKNNFEFEKIVQMITKESYQARHFTENEKGKLYIIEVMPTTEERGHFVLDFQQLDAEKTKVITKGFDSYGYENGRTKISAWYHQPETFEIFVLGEDVDFTIAAYTDGDLKEETSDFHYETTTLEVGVKDFLLELIKTDQNYGEVISETQIYNLYAKALDNYFTSTHGFVNEYDLFEQANYERIFSLVYTVQFPANSSKSVSVSYQTTGTMDMTRTVKPLYTFDYILNPAQNWSEFKGLQIRIIPPEQAPYIVSSSVDLVKDKNNIYLTNLAQLPEKDLTFTLYADEEITEKGQMKEFFNVMPVVILTIILFFIGVVFLFRRKR